MKPSVPKMPDRFSFIEDVTPVAEVVSALRAEGIDGDRSKFLGRLERRLTKARFQLRRLRNEETQAYIETGGGTVDPTRFVRQTEAILEKQQRAAEELRSEVDALKEKFATSLDSEAEKLIDESRNVAVGWFVAIGILLLLLWKLGQESQAKPERRVLRAKPATGEVDHEALTREFMARFPKLRAALAK
ncbi:MAG TPA: hypothetical protein VMI30_01635 [Stellaceae bacterium]|nr:hypothetical protein [Stellaceae bacterium]